MSVGLYDADFFKYGKVVINLEIMKLSAYYKRRGEVVSLTNTYRPSYFSKNYYVKDIIDGDYDTEVFKDYNKTKWLGRAYNQTKYKPLPKAIEESRPDARIYEKYKKLYGESIPEIRAFHRMLNANHFRISLDGKTIWKDYRKQLPRKPRAVTFYLHDYNIGEIDGVYTELHKLVQYYSKKFKRKIFFSTKYPLLLKNHKDIFKVIKLPFSDTMFYLEGIPEGELLVKLLSLNLGDSTYKRIVIDPTAGYQSEEEFFADNAPRKIYDIVTFLKSNESKISLKYTPNFFTEKRWESYIELLNLYMRGVSRFGPEYARRAANIVTLATFSASNKDKRRSTHDTFSVEDIREIFCFIGERDWELFRRFYELSRVKLDGKGGFTEWKSSVMRRSKRE